MKPAVITPTLLDPDQREAAAGAWQAYNAMETTKQRHINVLTMLDNKKKRYNLDPTPADTELLSALLADHDDQVKRFTAESLLLKQNNADAHRALFDYIGYLGEVMADVPDHNA